MLPDCIKKLIEDQVRTAYLGSAETLMSYGLKDFLLRNKTDADYYELVKEIKEVIATNPIFAKQYLGAAYSFFNSFNIVKVDIKHADVDAMIKEVMSKTEGVVNEKKIDAIIDESFKKLVEKAFGSMVSGAPVNTAATNNTSCSAERISHIDKVGVLYENFKQHLSDIFSDTIPVPNRAGVSVGSVNKKIEHAFDYLKQLRDLACTQPAA